MAEGSRRQGGGGGGVAVARQLEHLIVLSLRDLKRALLLRLHSQHDKDMFRAVFDKLLLLQLCRSRIRGRRMAEEFNMFMPNCHQRVGHEAVAALLGDGVLRAKEDEFMDSLHDLLLRGNYLLLGETDYQDACREDFLIELNVTMNRSRLCSDMQQRFLERHKGEPEFADVAHDSKYALLYHRGIGSREETGFFLFQKIDYVLSLLMAWLKWFILYPLGLWQHSSSSSSSSSSSLSPPSHSPSSSLTSTSNSSSSSGANTNNNNNNNNKLQRDQGLQSYTQVHRNTLAMAMKKAPMHTLFSSVTLTEPTFLDLVLMYREKKPSSSSASIDSDTMMQPVHIKSFSNVPMADVDMVLPFTRPERRPLDLVLVVSSIVGGLVAVIYEAIYLEMTDEDGWTFSDEMLSALWPLFTLLGGLIMKVFFQWQVQTDTYQKEITDFLFHHSLDSHSGVQSTLVEEAFEQELKELILAYYFVWRGTLRTTVSLTDLDFECERFLVSQSSPCNFQVDQPVETLRADGVFLDGGDNSIEALPPEQALARLDRQFLKLVSPNMSDVALDTAEAINLMGDDAIVSIEAPNNHHHHHHALRHLPHFHRKKNDSGGGSGNHGPLSSEGMSAKSIDKLRDTASAMAAAAASTTTTTTTTTTSTTTATASEAAVGAKEKQVEKKEDVEGVEEDTLQALKNRPRSIMPTGVPDKATNTTNTTTVAVAPKVSKKTKENENAGVNRTEGGGQSTTSMARRSVLSGVPVLGRIMYRNHHKGNHAKN